MKTSKHIEGNKNDETSFDTSTGKDTKDAIMFFAIVTALGCRTLRRKRINSISPCFHSIGILIYFQRQPPLYLKYILQQMAEQYPQFVKVMVAGI